MAPAEELTEYERERLAKIERNKALMERLALAKLASDAGLGSEGGRGRGRGRARGRGRGPREKREPARTSSRVEKLRKESRLTSWRGTRIERRLATHWMVEVDADVQCLGTATEDDRNLSGVVVPRNYFVEGLVADEPYCAWTDDDGWHHMIWGEDNVRENKQHARTEEKGCASASAAASIILREISRRKMAAYNDFLAARAGRAVEMLISAVPPSWPRPYFPTFVDPTAREKWTPQPVAAPFYQPSPEIATTLGIDSAEEEVKRKRDFRQQFSTDFFKRDSRDDNKIDVLDASGVEMAAACIACGIPAESTTRMRVGPDRRRSLCTACGVYYATMGSICRPKGFLDELNLPFEFVDLSTSLDKPKVEKVRVTLTHVSDDHAHFSLDVVEVEDVEMDDVEDVMALQRSDRDWIRGDRHSAKPSRQEQYARYPEADGSAVEDYPLDTIDWSSVGHFTKLVLLAGTGKMSNKEVMEDKVPEVLDEKVMLFQRLVPFAAHTHLKRMVMSRRYEKYEMNITDSERYKPAQVDWKPEHIDGLTIFGYYEERVQESLEAHMERRVEAASMDDNDDTKRDLLATIATEDLESRRTFDYLVAKGIDSFAKAAEKAIRDVERERERARRQKEAEEEEARREAEIELYGARRFAVDMAEAIGYTEKEISQFEGEEEIPEPISMICNGHIGMLQTMGKSRAERVHDMDSGSIVGAGEFERMSGCGSSKKWKSSCKKLQDDGQPGVSMLTHLIERGDEKGDSVIGRRVGIWWPTESVFYLGFIEGYNVANGEHTIRYDDGQAEDVMLFMQRVKWLEGDVLLPEHEGENEDENKQRVHIRPPGVAGAEEATVRVPLGGFSVYARVQPSTTTMKHSERRKCYEILNIVRNVEVDGRNLGAPFEKLPSRFVLPEYYSIIKCPVDCSSIERMLKKSTGGYPNVWFFLVAMELMFTNCKRFNDPASLLYRDSDVLRSAYLEAVEARFPGHPVPPSIKVYDSVDEPAWDKPASDGIIEDEDDPFPQTYVPPTMKTIVSKKRQQADDSDSESEEYAARPRKSQRSAPRDRRVPKDPIQCASYILARVQGNAMPLAKLHEVMLEKGVTDFATSRRPLAALGALLRQHPLMFRDARGGELWELVEKVEVYSDDEIVVNDENDHPQEMSDSAELTPPPPKLAMTRKETDYCRSVLSAIRASKDKKGRSHAEAFELLPTRKQLPAYYRAISNPIDLGSIQKCLNTGGYPSTWMFCVALELMLSNCQNYNEPSSVLYKDAEILRGVIAKKIQDEYPGHPLPERDSVYDAEKCVEPEWRAPTKKAPTLKFTMKPVAK